MSTRQREQIPVSHEMVALFGTGSIAAENWPAEPVSLAYTLGRLGVPATVRWIAAPTRELIEQGDEQLVLVVATSAMLRLFGVLPTGSESVFHISADLRSIAIAVRDCTLPSAAKEPYRLAKCIELLCDTMRLLGEGALVPMLGDCQLSQDDSRRILAARRMIEERWSEKLTLDALSRACGLNRAKLTRGFRDMFDCSIADALSSHRLEEARRMLLATDLPIASIGYRCGYLNNASFTRAFSRRFGNAPTQYRALGLAA